MRWLLTLTLAALSGCVSRQEVPAHHATHAATSTPTWSNGGTPPPVPSRHEVVRAMGDPALDAELRACGLRGTVQVHVVFRGQDGAAVEAHPSRYFRHEDRFERVAPQDADPPIHPSVWACAVPALMRLRLSPFQNPTFRVSFPIRVR